MENIRNSIERLSKDLFSIELVPDIMRTDEQFGDYATNVAMQLGKQLNKNPKEIAKQISEQLAKEGFNATIAGPGFVNITLDNAVLWEMSKALPTQVWQGKTVLTEYSDPNPLKPLHAGHLYTTLVGDSIAMLLENAGANVVRLNYGGDVGLHVGKCMWGITKDLGGENPNKLSKIPEKDRAKWLGECYVSGNDAYEQDEHAKQDIVELNKRVYQLHADNDKTSSFAQIYWTVRQWSYDYFTKLYSQLQVMPFDRFIPESEVTELGVSTVNEQLKSGIYQKSDGAVVFRGEDYGLHTRVFVNSAGLPTYETKDVGLILTKWEDYQFDMSLVITASEQAQYYQVMLKSVEQFMPEPVAKSRHLTHGTVKLKGGIKMSSRKGNVVTALEILDAARKAGSKSTSEHSEDSILAAVKYAFARQRIGGDIIYDPQESVALEGNSGPYLQYAHARARSILAKSQKNQSSEVVDSELEPGERSLLRKVSEYAETVDRAVQELMPHHICTYLYELAQAFNSFYEHNRVIGSERENIRLALVEAYANNLKNGLKLLNITSPNKM